MPDLHITPQLHLRGTPVFEQGNGPGLLALVKEQGAALSLSENYFRRFARDFITRLCNAPAPEDRELAPLFEMTRPSAEALGFFALEAPPMMGGEFLDAAFLAQLHGELEAAVRTAFAAFDGDFSAWLRTLGRHWQHVGKVSFHLAENKGATKDAYPFAFMASFIHRLSESDKPRHLPLATALKAYAHDRAALQTLLSPIQEAARNSELINSLLESRRIFQPIAWTPAEACAFLKDIPVFEEANIVVRVTNLWKSDRPPQAKVSVSIANNSISHLSAAHLLDFSTEVTIDGAPLTAAELRELLASDGGLVRLRGQWVEADPQRIAKLLARFEGRAPVAMDDGLRMLAGLDGLTDDERALCRINAAGAFKELLDRFGNPASIDLPPLPGDLARILRHYQLDGVKYLHAATTFGMGACLADDMGLGKTLQTLSLLSLWKNAGLLDAAPVLLAMPATLLANWKNEAAAFTPGLRVVILHPSSLGKDDMAALAADPAAFLAPHDLALISYGMLTRLVETLRRVDFPAVIADEAQALKNPGSKQSRAVRSLRARHRVALTGTPVENHLTDLWSLFDFINPGLLGSIADFKKFLKNSDGNYAPLRRLTRPFILRRLKTDKTIAPDLPDKTELNAWCNLSRKQAALYEASVERLAKALNDTDRSQRQGLVLAHLMQFKQICNHPAHFSGSGDFTPADSGKFLRLAELAEPIAARQEKLLLFTQFREMTDPLHDHLARCFGRPGLILHGATPVAKRRGLVDAFQSEDGPPFFVLSLKAAGTGLTLTAANHVVHFDRWWNPAVENQATDRAYRIGQHRNVLVHKFICAGTLEERINDMLAAKQHLADDLLAPGAEQLLTAMSNDQLIDFLKLDLTTLEQ